MDLDREALQELARMIEETVSHDSFDRWQTDDTDLGKARFLLMDAAAALYRFQLANHAL